MKSHLAQVLFHYHLTLQTTTGVSPSELLLGQRPRSRLLSESKTTATERAAQLKVKREKVGGGGLMYLYGTIITDITGYLVLLRREQVQFHSELS